MISISRMRELAEEELELSNKIIKKRIISNDTDLPITVNANKKGNRCLVANAKTQVGMTMIIAITSIYIF